MSKSKFLFAFLIVVLACQGKKETPAKTDVKEAEAMQESTWISLMSPEVWRGYNMDALPDNWVVKDSIIECFGNAGDMGGDIITREQFDNFELELEWKISPAGNSGVFYHVVESEAYHSPYQTGPEYQILDDVGFPDPLEEWQKTGANYAMHLPNDQKSLKPVGEWNSTKIVFIKGKAEHWLNGKKILEFDKFSEDWKERRDSGKWEKFPDYGKTNTGYLALQDHGAGVWFRNIRVRRL